MHWTLILAQVVGAWILLDLVLLGLWILFGPHRERRERQAIKAGRLVVVDLNPSLAEEAAIARARLALGP